MVSQLIERLAAYISKMEFQNKDFDLDKPVQYNEIRKEMEKFYDDIFGPVCLPYIFENELTQEKEKFWKKYFYKENEKIRKSHVRIQEN